MLIMRYLLLLLLAASLAPAKTLLLSGAEYAERARAIWLAQMVAQQLALPFEHRPAAVEGVRDYAKPVTHVGLDDDWYYEMILLQALEVHGPNLTPRQLGEFWDRYNVGTWGSSELARLNIRQGIYPPDSGHPRHNRLFFTMSNQARGELPGMLAPGKPNLAARLSGKWGSINSYAEGTDGGVLLAAMVSLGFVENDVRSVLQKALTVLPRSRPHRQAIEEMLAMARQGLCPEIISERLEDKWHFRYPATNNAPGNMALAMMALWFGEGDFMKTVNLAAKAADYTDADNNAAVAAAVVAAVHGMKAIPEYLWRPFNDRIRGASMGHLKFPAIDESITDLARRTATMGAKIMSAHGVRPEGDGWRIDVEEPAEQAAGQFELTDYTQWWNPAWTLVRAGYGASGGGLRGIRGGTSLDGEVLATYPRDEIRGMYLRSVQRIPANGVLRMEVAADPGRAWKLAVFAGNQRLMEQVIDGGPDTRSVKDPSKMDALATAHNPPLSVHQFEIVELRRLRQWRTVTVDLSGFAGREVILRLYQTILVPEKLPGNAYWRAVRLESR
jgi:hypothetical protein